MTALRVCVLRGWRGNNILCVTDQSEMHANYTPTHTPVDNTYTESQSDTPQAVMLCADDCEEAEPERDVVQSGVGMKHSRVISYQVRQNTLSSDWLSECYVLFQFYPFNYMRGKPRPSPLTGHSDRGGERGGGAVRD